jgi:uncharacterized protein involved in tolerance to divalent cations
MRRNFVLSHHAYHVPELVKLDMTDGSPAYCAWTPGK